MGLRADLAAHLRTALGSAAVVYEAGVDIIAVPAVVINPADPYQMPESMKPQGLIATGIDIHLIANRAEPMAALDMLEDLRKQVTDAIATNPPVPGRWVTFGSFGSTEVAGTQYAMATLEVVFMDND